MPSPTSSFVYVSSLESERAAVLSCFAHNQQILCHYSLLFESRSASPEALDTQAALCKRVLNIYHALGRERLGTILLRRGTICLLTLFRMHQCTQWLFGRGVVGNLPQATARHIGFFTLTPRERRQPHKATMYSHAQGSI